MSDEQEISVAWHRSVGSGIEQSRVLASLLGRHREPHRRYHTLAHVRWVLRHVDELTTSEPVDDLDAVVVAACFHDAVYDARRTDNEATSARLARRELTAIGWPSPRIDAVVEMIDATAGHVGPHAADGVAGAASPDDVAVLLDADLAILGAPPNAYDAYVNGVRAESAHVDDAAWRTGRGAVVAALLARDPLYRTATARARWGVRARANLTAELASLRGG